MVTITFSNKIALFYFTQLISSYAKLQQYMLYTPHTKKEDPKSAVANKMWNCSDFWLKPQNTDAIKKLLENVDHLGDLT